MQCTVMQLILQLLNNMQCNYYYYVMHSNAINSITVRMYIAIVPVIMSLCDYLPVCVRVFARKKIDQAGGPETFF